MEYKKSIVPTDRYSSEIVINFFYFLEEQDVFFIC